MPAYHGLEGLVDDILISILATLSVYDVLNLRQTSKRLEAISHERSVWSSLFRRETIDSGRPSPGYSFSCLLKTPVYATPDNLMNEVYIALSQSSKANFYDFAEACDLELRTFYALRLEKHWHYSDAYCNCRTFVLESHSKSVTNSALSATQDIFLLPGGRYLVTVHEGELDCWDLGFPARIGTESCWRLKDQGKPVEHLANWASPFGCRVSVAAMDSAQSDGVARFVILTDTDTLDRAGLDEQQSRRSCSVISVQYNQVHSLGTNLIPNEIINFMDDAIIALPSTLVEPVYVGRDTDQGSQTSGEQLVDSQFGPQRFLNGTLGQLIHVHSHLLFFSSYMPARPESVTVGVGSSEVYAGIEVVDWTVATNSFKSALLEYPDSQLGEYVGMHVYEAAAHIVVVWRACIGLYPIPKFSEAPERIVLMPTVIFALSGEVENPISFTTCHVNESVPEKNRNDIRSLTILARSFRNPTSSLQSVLVFRRNTDRSSENTSQFYNYTVADPTKYDFRLSRIPSGMWSTRLVDSDDIGSIAHALLLGPSGRGVRVDVDGSVYRCSPSSMILPNIAGQGMSSYGDEGSGQETCSNNLFTVDFWPYRPVGRIPELSSLCMTSVEKPIIRFDDGMGRLIVALPQNLEEGYSNSYARRIMVLDFA